MSFLLLAACAESPVAPGPGLVPGEINVVSDPATAAFKDPAAVVDAEVIDGDLRLTIEFAGGCTTHAFFLLAPPDFGATDEESTELAVFLRHDDVGDTCEAVVRETAGFDLKPVRDLVFATFGEPKMVYLRIHDAPDREYLVHYDPR